MCAVYNEIGIGRWNRFIQKLTDMKASPPARQLSSEIMFTHPIDSGNENLYLQSWLMHSASTVFASSTGNLNASRIRNPVGSNVIAVITQCIMVSSTVTADRFSIGLGPQVNDYGTVLAIPISRFDARFGNTASNMIYSITQQAGPGNSAPIRAQVGCGGDVSNWLIHTPATELPLLPGDAFDIMNQTVTTATYVSIWWRERVLEASER